MRNINAALAVCLAILTIPVTGWSKGEIAKIEIQGDDLNQTIEITNSDIVSSFSIWNGPGVRVNGDQIHMEPDRQSGAFIDWPNGMVAKRQTGLQRYNVLFYIGSRQSEMEALGTYEIIYEFGSHMESGFVYLPTSRQRAENTAFILHGVEGNWFQSSEKWEELVRPLIEKTIVAQTMADMSKSYPPTRLSPIHKMDVTVKKEQFNDLFDKLREFSNSNDFKFGIRAVHPNGERFSLGMRRADMLIIATNPFDVGEFGFGVYPIDGHKISKVCLSALMKDLKSLIGEVEGAIISEPRG